MSGRAGRRGMDDRGIVILMVDEKMSPTVGKQLLKVSLCWSKIVLDRTLGLVFLGIYYHSIVAIVVIKNKSTGGKSVIWIKCKCTKYASFRIL